MTTRATLGERAVAMHRVDTRAAMLARQLNGCPRDAARFDDLAMAPEWLGWPEAPRQRLGRAAALAAIGPTLASSVDGRWLGALAKAAGDDLLDWARTQRAIEAMPAFPASDLDQIAASALRDAVPPSLRDRAAPPAADANVPVAALDAAIAQCSI